jgi:uncharacterized protein
LAAPASTGTGWRRLALFWTGVVVVLAVGGGTLQVLGPVARPERVAVAEPLGVAPPVLPPAANGPPIANAPPIADAPPGANAPPIVSKPEVAGGKPAAASPPQAASPSPSDGSSAGARQLVVAPRPGRDTPGPVLDPDPALLAPAGGPGSALLPRIASDGRLPMQAYAAGFDRTSQRKRVGLLVAGVGLDEAASEAAVRTLPGAISLAISPYAPDPQKLLSLARAAEHEYLISLPMEPANYPLNDPDNQHALMTGATPEQNQERLLWVLSRIQGYVGVTGALGLLRGERFASLSDRMGPVFATLAQRGLLYIDPRPGTPPAPLVWSRSVDLVIDVPATGPDIDAKLAKLDQLARERGSALGLASSVLPTTLDRIAVWANGVAAKGLILTPMSALVQPPADRKAEP